LEARNGKKKLWQSIKCSDGTTKFDIDSILKEQVHLYSTLFRSEIWDKDAANDLLRNVTTTLSDDQQQGCMERVTQDNIENAIKQLKTNKSPGSDGIT
jgi:hypothetical protein